MPEAKVVGQLADQPGYLIQLPAEYANTNLMMQAQEALLALGVTGWHWNITGGYVRIRAYTSQQRTALFYATQTVLALLTVVAALLTLYPNQLNDIHRFAKAFGIGSDT